MNDLKNWLALWRVAGLNAFQFNRLRTHFKSVEAVLAVPKQRFLKIGFKGRMLDSILSPDWDGVEKDLAWANQSQCSIVPLSSPDYPQALKTIEDPPPLLFVKGSLSALNKQQMAVVGSRMASPAGLEIARHWSAQLVENGFAVTSGLALGIDGAAHRGALDEEGVSVAVLGHGLDIVYPYQHERLSEAILAHQGALVSELPIGVPPCARHFPCRNRIISGLSDCGVLVVEASLRSGSLITANLAAEQGRDVFAVPGSPYHNLSRGCHHLIQQGAKLVGSVEDILSEISISGTVKLGVKCSKPVRSKLKIRKAPDKKDAKLLASVGFEPTSLEKIVQRSGLPPESVVLKLTDWVVKGYLDKVGGTYMKKLCPTKS